MAPFIAVIRDLDPGLVTLAHEGTKAYTEAFDLVHRHEATAPNAVWQADHTELDIWLKDGRGAAREAVADHHPRRLQPRRGGLRVVVLRSPSAIQTALALRQAIWRKGRPGWQVCGIPGVLYSDHGSDFTSRHLEQVAADLKIRLVNSDGRAAPRPGEDRAVLRERRPGAPPAAARLWARRSRPESGADAGRDGRRAGAVPDRRVPQRNPHDDRLQAAGAVDRPAGSCRGCPSRWSSSTFCC